MELFVVFVEGKGEMFRLSLIFFKGAVSDGSFNTLI
jgi:hypothetical protein